jgi:hypothetical protein
MAEIKINEDILQNWIDNIFNRIYKNQEDQVLRQLRNTEMDKSLRNKIDAIVKDAQELKKDIKSGKFKINY